MDVVALDIPAVKLIRLRQFRDQRGFFSEIYNNAALREAGIDTNFSHDSISFSLDRGTVRGLHFQSPPAAQAKLITVLSGRALDVAVDCRKGSPTFGRHVAVELAGDAWNQIYLPVGFAHGLCTLEPKTSVIYKFSAPYAPTLERGILWNDPDLGIDWPIKADAAVLSEKDKALPRFRELPDYFNIDG